MLVDGLDLLSNQIDLKTRLSLSEMQLTQTLLLTQQTVMALKTRTAGSRNRIKQANDELISRMEEAVMHLGLTEAQETELIRLVELTEQKIDREVSESLGQEEEMNRILELGRDLKWRNSA
jgi:hypothetical protein